MTTPITTSRPPEIPAASRSTPDQPDTAGSAWTTFPDPANVSPTAFNRPALEARDCIRSRTCATTPSVNKKHAPTSVNQADTASPFVACNVPCGLFGNEMGPLYGHRSG